VRRRIGLAVAVTTGLAVVAFGIPLAIVVARQYRENAVLELQREATRAGQSVSSSAVRGGDPVEFPTSPIGAVFAVYADDGSLVAGTGPSVADESVRAALSGASIDIVADRRLVVAVPLSTEERIYAALRADVAAGRYRHQVILAWTTMALFGLMLVGLAALVTGLVANRLTRPVDRLIDDAEQLGSGSFSLDPAGTGIVEIDRAHVALARTAERLGTLVARERSFSAEVSHQLRTPITALRLDLDALQRAMPTDENLVDAQRKVDHLERTVTDMLALARDRHHRSPPIEVEPIVAGVVGRWRGPLAAEGRPLRFWVEADLPHPSTSERALVQILEVLLANARQHGRGEVSVRVRSADAAVVIDVTDQGPGFDDADPLRPDVEAAPAAGRGLPLARRLATADGADLRVVQAGPKPIVRLLLPADSPVSSASGGEE